MTEAERTARLISLLARYNQIGRLLPQVDDIDLDDQQQVAECRLLLAELKRTQAQIDALPKRQAC